jgi:AraC-like DNA-binding protein
VTKISIKNRIGSKVRYNIEELMKVNFEKIEFPNGMPYIIKVQSITRSPIHWHDGVTEIILPLKGSIKVISNFEYNYVHEGDFVFVNNKCIHSIQSNDNAIVAIFYINLEHFEQQFEHIKYMFFRSNLYTEDSLGITESNLFDNDIRSDYKNRFINLLISLLYSNKNSGDELDGSMLNKFEYQLIYSMVNEFNWLKFMRITNKYFVSSVQLDRYHRTIKYIDEHYPEKITLDDIVSREFVTKTYFSHFWKSFTSFSFRDRLNYERAIRSEFYLLNGTNISKTSELCGFSDVKYYYRAFKKWYGCMPKEHKARCEAYEQKKVILQTLEIDEIDDILESYSEQYRVFQCIQDPSLTSFIENYMKLQELYKIEKGMKANATKSLVIDPFKYSDYHLENNTIVFDWQNMDLCVNLSLDLDFTLNLRLNCDNIEKGFFYNTISSFIDGCLFRYGSKIVNRWHFFVNYNDIAFFNEVNNLEGPFGGIVNNIKIDYSFTL